MLNTSTVFFSKGLRKNPKLLEIIENDFSRMVPRDLNVTDERERVTRDIRQFYLGNKQVGIESVDEMIAVRNTPFPQQQLK